MPDLQLNTFNEGGPFIVAEISKNWIRGEALTPDMPPLCVLFERAVNVNWDRGYRLVSFQLHRLMAGPDAMNETIIAVFERRSGSPEADDAVARTAETVTG